MVVRICKLPLKQSFFLFGARGTGKTTLLEHTYSEMHRDSVDTLAIDLLDPDQEEAFLRTPNLLRDRIENSLPKLRRVILDEIQKVPKLLDVVQGMMRRHPEIQFVLTGSSARKLRHGGGNLLGGRAFGVYLHPFTFLEIPDATPIGEILTWGTLPRIFGLPDFNDRKLYLKAYCQSYLKEEIQLEQLARNMTSFREFLDLAAQSNGEIINFSNISKQSGVGEKTIARYYEILVDTLVGFFLEPFDLSVRARQSQKPKFYLFDTGIQRYLTQAAGTPLAPHSSEFGRLFEQWIICECRRLNDYFEKDYKFYFLRTKDDVEIDLIIRKPKGKVILIEIKSTHRVLESHYQHLLSIGKDLKHAEKWIICNEEVPRKAPEGVRILPWKVALRELFPSAG